MKDKLFYAVLTLCVLLGLNLFALTSNEARADITDASASSFVITSAPDGRTIYIWERVRGVGGWELSGSATVGETDSHRVRTD